MEPTDTHDAAGLGRRVRVARINAGLHQHELAEAIGVSREYITHIENGRKIPSAVRISRIAKVCDVPREAIAGTAVAA